MYAIVDIETTGGSPKFEKITEIAIVLHNGQQVVEEFSTLINPEKSIPYHITGLTGITNEMVADAPRFFEVARKIVEMTDGHVFVAHNASFDYQFIKEEFARLGFDYKRNTLCTVKLSRKIIPGKRSYSLGNLCEDLGITIYNRHRASGDALATAQLFSLLLSVNGNAQPNLFQPEAIKSQRLHPSLDVSSLSKLPGKAGVYYFLDDQGAIIYIGKSNDIQSRILSHFSNHSTKKAMDMVNQIASIDFELTGSELVALLLESEEIKYHKPRFNRKQRRTPIHSGLFCFTNENGYMEFQIGNNASSEIEPLTSFNSIQEAKQFLHFLIQRYRLCQKLCGLYPSSPCFQYQLGECSGACCGEERPEVYNQKVRNALGYFEFDSKNFFVLDTGRSPDEMAVVQVKNGKYIGFGYISKEISYSGLESLFDCIKGRKDNGEVQQIIKLYIRKNKALKIIPY
jgi:DNA polymerase III subunit epsilon